jgi:acetylornithine deacetylase
MLRDHTAKAISLVTTSPNPQELLATLVGFDTTSAKSNLPLVDFVRDYLARQGVEARLLPSPEGDKANLFATIGKSGDGGVGLSAHSDCVPVAGQDWSSDPFTLTAREDRLYGRGTCDMKGYIACVLAAVPLFKQGTAKQPVHILISYDEEVGCTGVRPMIARLGQELPRPSAIVVGEPSRMRVIDAHKRIEAYTTIVTGREAHSSLPKLGVNAIAYAAELIGELERIGADLATGLIDARFDPPVTTVQAGTIKGGTAANIVPRSCKFRWQVRSLPSAEPREIERRLTAFAETVLLPRMRAVAATASIETNFDGSVPAFEAKPGSEAVALAQALTDSGEAPRAVSYATEAGLFEEAGCATVICGPGDIAQAHAPDEFVSVAQLDDCMGFLDRLARQLTF